MDTKNIVNLNDFTLLEDNKIYFYPENAINNTKITKKSSKLCVLFELNSNKGQTNMYIHLYDKDNIKIYSSYSILLEEISPYNFLIINGSKNKNTIDFKNLNYKSFLKFLRDNKDLVNMIEELKNGLEDKKNILNNKKEDINKLSVTNILSYFQNINGFLINKIENVLSIREGTEDYDLSKIILRNIRNNSKLVIHNEADTNLIYYSLYSIFLKNIKSNHLRPKDILDIKDLKVDTNKTMIPLEEFTKFLASFEDSSKTIESLVGERIIYILDDKKNIKEYKNYLKVIMCDDLFIDNDKKIRSIKEISLKDLIIDSLSSYNYYPLTKNRVLLYNVVDNNVNFVTIISIDLILDLFKTYKINNTPEYKNKTELFNSLVKLINDDKVDKKELLELYILLLLNINIYCHKNIEHNIIFDSEKLMLNYEFKNGKPVISIIDSTKKKYAHLAFLSTEAESEINKSIKKSEKAFKTVANKYIYNSLERNLDKLSIGINIDDITHDGVHLKFGKKLDVNVFKGTIDLGELLVSMSSIKRKKMKIINEENIDREISYVYGLSKDEYDYIMRNAKEIATIMEIKDLDNPIYKEIVQIYNEFSNYNDNMKEEKLSRLKKLLEIK